MYFIPLIGVGLFFFAEGITENNNSLKMKGLLFIILFVIIELIIVYDSFYYIYSSFNIL